MNKTVKYIFFLIVIYTLNSCNVESTNYPDTPQIRFIKSYAQNTVDKIGNPVKKVTIEFYLIDGNGDFGLTQSDTVFPFIDINSSNFFPTLYICNNGEFEVDTQQVITNYKIPYVGDLGQDKALKAYVYVDFEYTNTPTVPFIHDSIYYSFYVIDRRFNQSNHVFTDTIVFSKID